VTADRTEPNPVEPPEEDPRQGGPVLGVVAGTLPILIGLVTLWPAAGLGLGSMTEPGPGLWPAFVASLLIASGIVIVGQGRRATDTEAFTRGTTGVAVGVAGLAGYAYLFELVGFETPTVLLLVLWLRFLGGEGWITTCVVSVLATAAASLLFITLLGVPLPHLIGT
jgi:hypothetical protein